MADKTARLTRRDEYAEATRQAIIDAARKLFCEQGFFGTKVEDIAATARVSPATIYSVVGGKQGLLQRLMELGTANAVTGGTLHEIQSARDPVTIIDMTARLGCEQEQLSGDIMRLILETAPHDEAAAQTCDTAIRRCREALAVPAQRLADMGALKHGLNVQDAVDILWFYFGFSSRFMLLRDNGWSPERAASWLAEQARHALLKAPQG